MHACNTFGNESIAMERDIENSDDVKLMVDSFYKKVNEDDLLGPIFNDLVKIHWESHLLIMYGFWNNILFSTGEYSGRPFQKHAPLPINDLHFERWLALFNKNLDELFVGEKTELVRFRAKTIGAIFSGKLSQLRNYKQ